MAFNFGSKTFGKTTKGASESFSYAGYKFGCSYDLPEDGTVKSISVYFGSTGFNAKAAIYRVSDGKLMVQSQSEAITTVGWHTFTIPSTPLVAGTYGLAVKNSLDAKVYYDVGVTNQAGRNLESYTVDFPDLWGTNTQLFATAISVYATYSTSTSQFGWTFPLITALKAIYDKFRGTA